jgi:hypothetical protein
MIRGKQFATAFGVATVLALMLIALNLPVSGGMASGEKTAPPSSPGVQGSGQVQCAPAPTSAEAPSFEPMEGGSCKADPASVTLPDWNLGHGGRTCRCSCGYPCKTDADCGGGIGSCRGGISCC